tara:strand:- start:4336 stop:4980 length:645 start_codon:yes stop_codon:yes gene_type:complete
MKIIVPNDLSEITLEQYQEFLILKDHDIDNNTLTRKMIEIFCDVPAKYVDAMKLKDIAKISRILNDMFEQKPELVKMFKIGNIEYGFLPNLDAMSFGEYVDLDTYISDWQNMERAMNVLYRPVVQKWKDKYVVHNYTTDTSKDLKQMPMDAVVSSMLFFYNLGIDLCKNMTNYLEEKPETHFQLNHNFTTSGDGFSQFMHSLREILEESKISLK